MQFRPMKRKVVFSACAVVLWYLLMLLWTSGVFCAPCTILPEPCAEGFRMLPNDYCGCACTEITTLRELLGQLGLVMVPGLMVYLIWSLVEKKPHHPEKSIPPQQSS